MPFDIAKMQARTKRVTAEFDGETFDVWYKPGAMTAKAMKSLDERGNGVDAVVEALGLFVSEWDVVDADGKRVPPSADELAQYPVTFLSAVLQAIMDDITSGQQQDQSIERVPLTALQ